MLFAQTGLLASLLAFQAAGPEVVVRTLDGKTIEGALLGLGSKHVEVQAADGKLALEASNLIGLRPKTPPAKLASPPPVQVRLVDGSLLKADTFTVGGDQAEVSAGGQKTLIPAALVAHVRYRDPVGKIAQQWDEILSEKPSGDLMVLRTGDNIDFREGQIGDVTAEVIKFNLGGKNYDINIAERNVDGLVFLRTDVPKFDDPLCILADSAGSQINVKDLALNDGRIEATALAGFTVNRGLDALNNLDFSAGKIMYLAVGENLQSDELGPEGAPKLTFYIGNENSDYLSRWRAPRKDRWGVDRPLVIDGQKYDRGLAIRSRSELKYRLRRNFRNFSAVAGIDDEGNGAGHVRLVILGDGQTLYDQPISAQDKERQKPISLDVSSVSLLTVLVDFGEQGDTSDFLDLCEAKVTK